MSVLFETEILPLDSQLTPPYTAGGYDCYLRRMKKAFADRWQLVTGYLHCVRQPAYGRPGILKNRILYSPVR